MTTKLTLACLIFLMLISIRNYGQNDQTNNFYSEIKKYDLSTVFNADSVFADNYGMIKRQERLGFIGNDYQRLYIHFVSIIQNPTNPYEYFTYGKTKVKGTIRQFHGLITISVSRVYKTSDMPNYKQGFAECIVRLYEDRRKPSTGIFAGSLKSNFVIDAKGRFGYDALMFTADGFSNNSFVGSWTSYGTKSSKKCNWGDYRIPDSGDFDIGAGQFSVNEQYVNNGWQNYKLAWSSDSETAEVKRARRQEDIKWWEYIEPN